MDIQLAVFDIAGTTVEDHGAVQRHLQLTLLQGGVELPYEDACFWMGYPKDEAIAALLSRYRGTELSREDGLVQDLHRFFLDNMDAYYRESDTLSEKPGAAALFAALKDNGVSVALDTGFGRSTGETVIGRMGWLENGLVDLLVTSDEVAQGRPFPDMIYLAMQKLGVASTDYVAKIGDTKSDLLQGKAAGCRYVIGVTTGAFEPAELAQYPHTHLVGQLSEIAGILGL